MKKNFSLVYIGSQVHMMMPHTSSILVAQSLYDILFQYIMTPEKEALLKNFADRLREHIKTHPSAPFSLPMSKLTFLNEGLKELQLLNWQSIKVEVFRVISEGEMSAEDLAECLAAFSEYAIVNLVEETKELYVYPYRLVR